MAKSVASVAIIALVLSASPVSAQLGTPTNKELGQIIDVGLREVVSLESRAFGTDSIKHPVLLDYTRTFGAFGMKDLPAAIPALQLRAKVTAATRDIVGSCNPASEDSCKALGAGTYTWFEPVSVQNTDAIVWIHRTRVVGPNIKSFSTELYLERSSRGPWRFVRNGKVISSP